MDPNDERVKYVNRLISELHGAIKDEFLPSDFAFVFCFVIEREDMIVDEEVTAGYSWSVRSDDAFQELVSILDSAYQASRKDKGDWLDDICLN
jgi:hypothetical protein